MIKVYYHKNCFDGICSAWVAWKKFGDSAQYIPINYGEIFEGTGLSKDDDIYFIDFSLARPQLDFIYSIVRKLVVLDHHKSAEIELEGADYAVFDLNESGASLAWQYFFHDKPMPLLVRYVKDRDLWLFNEPGSRKYNAYIQSYEMTIANYEQLNAELGSNHLRELAFNSGSSLLRYQDKLVKDMCKNFIIANIGGHLVPVVNASVLFSGVGDALCSSLITHDNSNTDFKEPVFSAYYFDRFDKRQWGLRSRGAFDVSLVAKKYNGGGHKNAAGFITEKGWLGD